MKFLKALALAATTVALAACGGSDTEDRLDVRDPVVRLLHAVPNGPNVSFYRDNVAQADAANMPYKDVSVYYDVSNSSATYDVRATAAPNVVLASEVANPEQGRRYTFVAVQGSTPVTVDLLLIDDPYNKSLTSSNARVRVLHGAPDAAGVDVYLLQPAQDLATAAPTIPALTYKNVLPASGQDSLELSGGTYRLVLTAAGTKTIVFNAPTVSIPANADWLLVALPDSGGTSPVRVLVAQGNDDADGTTVELVSQ